MNRERRVRIKAARERLEEALTVLSECQEELSEVLEDEEATQENMGEESQMRADSEEAVTALRDAVYALDEFAETDLVTMLSEDVLL